MKKRIPKNKIEKIYLHHVKRYTDEGGIVHYPHWELRIKFKTGKYVFLDLNDFDVKDLRKII